VVFLKQKQKKRPALQLEEDSRPQIASNQFSNWDLS